MRQNKFPIIIIGCILALLAGCRDTEDTGPDSKNHKVKSALHQIMKDWYLWNDKLPVVDINSYNTADDLLNALRNTSTDRWSYIEDEKTFDQFFDNAQFVGLGFGMKADASQNVRVSFVYRDSPIDKQGVTRGYKLLKVNGQQVSNLLANGTLSAAFGENKTGVQVNMEVEDLMGNTRSFVVGKDVIQMNTVLYRNVYQTGSKKVGYLVFNTFVDKSVEELNEAFAFFQTENITELVLDLRYNGGGSVDVAQHLASLIGNYKAGSNKFVELTYNTNKQTSNKPFPFKSNSLSINLERVFVITSRSSASASEAIINGLKPHMIVFTIGEATHGKPVGMNVWKAEGYAIVPITFKVANSNGHADYFNGIPVDAPAQDDLAVLFGDMKEDCLEQTLYYIANGTFSPVLAYGRVANINDNIKQINLTGFKAEVGAF